MRPLRVGATAALFGLCGMVAPVHAQKVDYSQVTRPVVRITDAELIEYLLFELIIETIEPPTMLQVIDVTQNGYGPDDIIVAYPTVEAFLIPEFLPDSVQRVMSSWAPEVEFRLDSGNLPADALAALIESDVDTTKRAENAILYDVVQAVERNYRDLPVGIRFERDSVGFTFQMWDYSRSAMHYTPRPAFVSDSAVSSVLTLLKDVGYLPGQSDAGLIGVSGRVASVEQALFGIRSFPDQRTQQLAARTVLVGSLDFDRSGAIDGAREIDALTCDIWLALDGTFPGVLSRLGFIDGSSSYTGSTVLNISERVRVPAGRRGAACLAGTEPPLTSTDDVAPGVQSAPPPQPVSDFLGMEAAAGIVRDVGGLEPGSADWARGVRNVLVQRFDDDASEHIDRTEEIMGVPCVVWVAIGSTYGEFASALGFGGGGEYLGQSIGIDVSLRDEAESAIRSCDRGPEATVPLRVAVRGAGRPVGDSRPGVYSLETALEGIRSFPAGDVRQLAARTILLSFFDADRSGYIDSGREIDEITCGVWTSLNVAFPNFVERFGFTTGPGASGASYQGSIVFNISDRLREPAARRIGACLRGDVPPITAGLETRSTGGVVQLPVSLRAFLDVEIAVRIARTTAGLEPGSAGWAAVVRSVLLGEYDLDGSGVLDAPAELDEIPCVVWNTVQSTYGRSLDDLGFGGTPDYLGGVIGVIEDQRTRAAVRYRACAL